MVNENYAKRTVTMRITFNTLTQFGTRSGQPRLLLLWICHTQYSESHAHR